MQTNHKREENLSFKNLKHKIQNKQNVSEKWGIKLYNPCNGFTTLSQAWSLKQSYMYIFNVILNLHIYWQKMIKFQQQDDFGSLQGQFFRVS